MIAIEALQIALSKEKAAVEAYRQMILDYPALKDLLYSLMNEEEKHVALIEKKIVDLSR